MNMSFALRRTARSVLLIVLTLSGGCADVEPAVRGDDPSDVAALEAPVPLPSDAGAAPRGCSPAACQRTQRTAQADLSTWSLPVQICCRTRSQCGLQVDPEAKARRPAATSIVEGLQMQGCVAPAQFALTAATFREMATTAFKGAALPIRDGGVDLPDGGRIDLDDTCPAIDGDTGLFTFHYPGCCLPSGQCGTSNHLLPGLARSGEQIRCLSFEELESHRSEFIPVPEQPTACTP